MADIVNLNRARKARARAERAAQADANRIAHGRTRAQRDAAAAAEARRKALLDGAKRTDEPA